MDLPGKADHQRLAYRQSQIGGDRVISGQTGGVHPVIGRDGIHTFAGAHYMARHFNITSPKPMRFFSRYAKQP